MMMERGGAVNNVRRNVPPLRALPAAKPWELQAATSLNSTQLPASPSRHLTQLSSTESFHISDITTKLHTRFAKMSGAAGRMAKGVASQAGKVGTENGALQKGARRDPELYV